MEAALRTAYEKLTGETCEQLDFTEVRGVEGVKESKVKIGDKTLSVIVANGLENAKIVLDKVQRGEKKCHMIEIMACPGGCIGGGGQPYPPPGMHIMDAKLLRMRAKALYTIDHQKQFRKSHENPYIQKLYDRFLGEPNGPKAHELLHTHYEPKLPRGVR